MTAKGYCELDRAQLTKEQKLGLLLCANLSQGEKDLEDALTKTGRGRSFDLMLPSIAENARAGTYLAGGVIGEGVVPVKRCLSILKAAGYDGYVSIEFEGCEDCVAAIGRGHANLKSYIESL